MTEPMDRTARGWLEDLVDEIRQLVGAGTGRAELLEAIRTGVNDLAAFLGDQSDDSCPGREPYKTAIADRDAEIRDALAGRHAVIVASGGIDSTTVMALHWALGHQLTAVTIDYGQRHRREIEAARQVSNHYGADHVVVDLSCLASVLGGSALTDPAVEVPLGHYAAPAMAATVVPNRNAILANVAVGVAVARKADVVVLGVHAGDHPIYPDCRPEFVDALNACVRVATDGYHTPRVEAPFVHWSKAEVVALAARLDAPLGLTWSCYQGGDLHCGQCGTCVERAEAFALAGVHDPTRYAP